MMKSRPLRVGLGGLMAVTALSAAPAIAKDGDVVRTGNCSGPSDWKLKISPEDGNLEVEYEVDTPKVGQKWRVRLRHNGKVFFKGIRTTKAPSGSFEVRGVVNNASGTDKFRARARNLATDELCRGRASK